ncbi:hypothetical protein [Streptococcus equi]|uniref:hypothetical protein n=1 Tax=Streptococcus equi TaxID=1336 RepID=UPI001BB58C06|nr:hypothetical protein [Streptococcus equi]MDI5954047.1 hypothetical protein [Streptococcus equi subsp. zooepidemicus]QTZ59057.1 hypothetical protein MCPGFBBE_01162 [Streptococcus equi subsp. zooepidemicus]
MVVLQNNSSTASERATALAEGRYLKRKTQASLEQSHEELSGEQRRLYQEEEALTRQLRLVKEKERANEY